MTKCRTSSCTVLAIKSVEPYISDCQHKILAFVNRSYQHTSQIQNLLSCTFLRWSICLQVWDLCVQFFTVWAHWSHSWFGTWFKMPTITWISFFLLTLLSLRSCSTLLWCKDYFLNLVHPWTLQCLGDWIFSAGISMKIWHSLNTCHWWKLLDLFSL